jgi:NAD(P)-dependent dehydrogenase (short-subunit alcohol dehydrogenase family)
VRTCVVTGSASGIGAATRARLERDGDRVIGVDVRDAEVVADLATEQGRSALAEQVSELADGVVDAVVACAGVSGGTGRPETVIRVNYFGAVATLDRLRPLLARSAAPRAVAVSSIALQFDRDPAVVDACLAGDEEAAVALVGGDATGGRAYAAGKRALARWVRRQATTAEWAGARIALNAVAPGVIRTPLSHYMLDTPEGRAEAAAQIPMPLHGFGEPEHVASLIAFLTSGENVLVTAQVVFVDGGFEALQRGEDVW